MISYYLLITVVDALTAVNEDDWQIAADIKDGNISQFLLKPIDYLWYRLCLFLSGRLTYLAVAVIPLALFILYLHQYFVLPPDWTAFGCFLVSTVLTALLQFFMSYTMAMLAFWVLEVSTFIFILYRLRIHRQRPPVPAGHPAARPRTGALLHAVPLSALFSRQHLHGQDHRRGLAPRLADPGPLGGRRLLPGALRLAPGHQAILRGGRVT